MTRTTDLVWAAVIAAEDEYGERAEEFARGEAVRAAGAGDIEAERHWKTVADELHKFHTINRQWARPQREGPQVSAASGQRRI